MRKVIVILLVLLLVLGGGGAAGYFFFGTAIKARVYGLLGKPVPGAPVAAAPPPGPPAVPLATSYYKLPRVMGTVVGANDERHMLQASISVYLHNPGDLLFVQAYLPRINDAFQTYIRDDIVVDRQHPVDIDRMRRIMLPRINAIIAPGRIDDIVVLSLVIE